MHKKESSGEGYVKWFSELSNKDIAIAGGKGASLGEMFVHKFPIPPGFVITAQAYSYFLEKTGLSGQINHLLHGLDIEDTAKLNHASKSIRSLFANAEMPADLREGILEAYDILSVDMQGMAEIKRTALDILKNSREGSFVAVRSSATTEDLADASFAGQQESFLNVKGNHELIEKVKECASSLFTPRAIYYRATKGFDHANAQLAVVIQKMVNADKAGVMFSRDPTSNNEHTVIEAVWGLGEGIVSGMIKPDLYVIDKNIEDFKVLRTDVAEKKVAVTRTSSGKNEVVPLNAERAKRQVLSSYELRILANHARHLEEHYKKPQDIEFAISGTDIFIVQSRPITTTFKEGGALKINGTAVLHGLGASGGVGSGVVRVIHHIDELSKVKKGDVLVTQMTNPDMVVSMQKAAAIITDEGGITSHAAIVSREMGIPAVVGTGNATKTLHDGLTVTVDGFSGKVYEGKGETQEVVIHPIVPTKTEIKVIVDIPDFAVRAAQSGAKGVGLVRLEGIIATLGRHPHYYLSAGKTHEYVKSLYGGLKHIAEHFDHMWIRTSDLRSDEFAHLEGNKQGVEGNPMLGNHGVRYSLMHTDIMKAELMAIKELAESYPSKKFGIMIPQVISVAEVKKTKELADSINMPSGVEFGIMVETPAAVQIINDLCDSGISFVSFGTNDLTQYMLAIDRNNPSVQPLFDEMNPAVLSALSYVIRRCKKFGIKTSICGQAGSKEAMARFLVGEGIDSISCNADAAAAVSKMVASIEAEKAPALTKHAEKTTPHTPVVEVPTTHTHVEQTHLSLPDSAPSAPQTHKHEPVHHHKAPEHHTKHEPAHVHPHPHQHAHGSKDAVVASPVSITPNADIEDVVLKELEEAEFMPGNPTADTNIPPLNDAIPISSEHFDVTEKKEDVKEVDVS